jgi:hypothetical protein
MKMLLSYLGIKKKVKIAKRGKVATIPIAIWMN